MTKREFRACVQHAGMAVPEGAEEALRDLFPAQGDPLLSDGFLTDCARRGGLGEKGLRKLRVALQDVRGDEWLMRLSCALRDDAHRAVLYQRACDFTRPEPLCLGGFSRRAYALLFALSCLERGLQALAGRGIPPEHEDVCRRMADKQMRMMEETGSPEISDYAWDMNFYSCAIFFHDRLYFVPFRWESPQVFRSLVSGMTVALWPAGNRVRRDGQLDGVNGVHDPQALATTWAEDDDRVTAYPVNPVGVIRLAPITLPKNEWLPALSPGDMTLAAHIPGGEGYTPERWKSSMEKAKAFFDRWFPEIVTRGFWSESWLYDPGLYRLLPKDGRILRVARQFYNYPTMEGECMAKLEVFGAQDADLAAFEPKTSLQRSLRESLLRGEHYHTTGMFVLHGDLPCFGQSPYQKHADIEEYLALREVRA